MEKSRERTWQRTVAQIDLNEAVSVPLSRIIHQRTALVDLAAHALRQPTLQSFFSHAVRIAAAGTACPMAKFLRPEDGELLIAAGWGLKEGVVGHARVKADDSNPAGEALARSTPVAVIDLVQRQDYDLPRVMPEHGVVATANVPILVGEETVGVLEVDTTEERQFDQLEVTFLAAVASVMAEGVVRLREKQALEADRDAKITLLREQQHRIRNNFMTIVGLLQKGAKAAPETTKASFHEIERRVFALSSLYDHLLGSDEQTGRVDLSRYLGSLCDSIQDFYGLRDRDIEMRCDRDLGILAALDVCTIIGTVVNELVANSVEHAFAEEGGKIAVSLRRAEDVLEVLVEDDGPGFELSRKTGAGLSTAQRLLRHAGGRMERQPRARGTCWMISLPSA